MRPEQERGLPTVPPTAQSARTLAEEAKHAISALMREAPPRSPQARALSHLVRWYGAVLPRAPASRMDDQKRQYRERGRLEAIMERHSERSPAYEAERDFALLLIEGYTAARREELLLERFYTSPHALQTIIAQELKAMQALAKAEKRPVMVTPPQQPA